MIFYSLTIRVSINQTIGFSPKINVTKIGTTTKINIKKIAIKYSLFTKSTRSIGEMVLISKRQ